MKFHKKLSAISLGQGQGPRAEAMMRQGMDRGRWVFFQNCHLSPSWMPALERLIEQIDADKVGKCYYKSRLKYHNNLAIGKRCTRELHYLCKCTILSITVESRNYAPLLCALALGKTGEGAYRRANRL